MINNKEIYNPENEFQEEENRAPDDAPGVLTDNIDEILAQAVENSEKQMWESSNGSGSGGGDGNNAVSGVEDIGALKREVEEASDRYLRLMAEFDNYKRRTAKEYERMIDSANEKLLLEMVDVRENFERALKAGEQGGEAASFIEGMRLIFVKFDETLGRHGLSAFAEPGDQFDPTIHDALMNTSHAEIPADHITEVFEHGYRLKERVIKHARVIVSNGAGE